MIMQPMLPLGDLNVATCTILTGGAGVAVVVVLVLTGVAVVVDCEDVAADGVEEVSDVVTVTVLVADEPQPRAARASAAAARGVARLIM